MLTRGAGARARAGAGRAASRWRRRRRAWARRGQQLAGLAAAAFRAVLAAPLKVRLLLGLAATVAALLAVNWVYQVVRKPAELFFPVSGVLSKPPAGTWRHYGPIFREHSTAVMTPELLAALAQVEGAGNPFARTYWRWSLTRKPFEVYRPASSAVGMYQITNGTFRQAKRYCIHHHAVVEDGPWHDLSSCWFNGLYSRIVPSHAVEMTSAYLDRNVEWALVRQRIAKATLQQKQDLAALIHLCGPAVGEAYAKRGFRLTAAARCGGHDARAYLARVNAMKLQFSRLAATAD